MNEQERENQVVYLLKEGMYSMADSLIKEYGMNMSDVYQLAFPQDDRSSSSVSTASSAAG